MKKEKMLKFNNFIFIITMILMILNIIEMFILKKHSLETTIFRMVQYICMLLILKIPFFLKHRFKVSVPLELSVIIVWFAFNALVLGDCFDFYGKFTWWDSFLHLHSGIILSFVALWIIHFLLKDKRKYIYLNKYFVAIFLICFSLAMGAIWELLEYTGDEFFNLNTQQYMETTESSIITNEDVPLVGHDALNDTMKDLFLDLFGALVVASYAMIEHDRLVLKYRIEELE